METITITVEKDSSCNMARVNDSIGTGMEGNFWDFHNGCHGMDDLPEFNSVEEFVEALRTKQVYAGNTVEIIRKNYTYGE